MIDIRNTDDIIDVRDIIAVIEAYDNGDEQETGALRKLLGDLRDRGAYGIRWRGAWYPLFLIRDRYFTDHTYTAVDYDGVTYWFR